MLNECDCDKKSLPLTRRRAGSAAAFMLALAGAQTGWSDIAITLLDAQNKPN